jgi:hypothetical protein
VRIVTKSLKLNLGPLLIFSISLDSALTWDNSTFKCKKKTHFLKKIIQPQTNDTVRNVEVTWPAGLLGLTSGCRLRSAAAGGSGRAAGGSGGAAGGSGGAGGGRSARSLIHQTIVILQQPAIF